MMTSTTQLEWLDMVPRLADRGWLFGLLGIAVYGLIGSIIAAVIGAIILLVLLRLIRRV
jgi:hypothetical protein